MKYFLSILFMITVITLHAKEAVYNSDNVQRIGVDFYTKEEPVEKITGLVNQLDAQHDDVGDIVLSGSSAKEFVSLSGVGDYDGFDLITDSANVYLDGVGDIKVSVKDHLKVVAKGVGKVYYKGDPVVDANVSGTGELIKVN